ncbi:MAG: dipicolinate synthase subunit B, partial [Clostridia bacterium]|nr:dipicolinate synthase subunit B [Clostridia bacterium]
MRVGVALCGSFCTFSTVLPQIREMCKQFDVVPIMSETAYQTDTRFGAAADFVHELEEMCGHSVLHTVTQTEPIGPKKLLDVLVVAPATGNTLAKLAVGIADSAVTLAVKAHLRNERPVVLAVSTNDALGTAAKNIGALLGAKNMYFVPLRQDDPFGKPRSVVADMSRIADTVHLAADGKQIQ